MKLLKSLLIGLFMGSGVVATDENLPESFKGETQGSPIEIDYSDWSLILSKTVIGSSRTTRSRGKSLNSIKSAPTGSRITRKNKSDTRNDGNRIDFRTLSQDINMQDLAKIRRSLEAVPSEAPLRLWSKDEQLAYWLNLYNITLIEHLAREYPFRKLKKLKRARNGIWNQKLLNVAGNQLSLDDIQHKILPAKWNTTLVIYGLFQGYISGPSIQKTAFTGKNVRDLLMRSAKEFVNSNRGMKTKGSNLQIAKFYQENGAMFPNWQQDVKAHIYHLSNNDMKARVQNTTRIKFLKTDYYTTDVYAGGKDIGTAYNNNLAALEFANVGASDMPGAGGAISSVDGATSILSFMRDLTAREIEKRRIPAATRDYVLEMRKDELRRKGDVRIEDVSEDKN